MQCRSPVAVTAWVGMLGLFAGLAFGRPDASPPGAAPVRLADLEQAFIRIVDTSPAAAEWATGQLHLRKARFFLERFEASPALREAVERQLDLATSCLTRLRSEPPPSPSPGFREEAYYCDTDGSVQPFLRYIPKTPLDAGVKRPLLVFLHGYNPYLNLVNWAGSVPENLAAFAEREGFAVAAPFGRGNTDYQGIGEQDVLTVIETMKSRYDVDPDRIILSGHSMGGMGVWSIGARHPDRFAGLLIVSGRGDYYAWHRRQPADMPFYKRAWIETWFAAPRVERLSTIPIYCAHGARDDLVPVREARVITDRVSRENPALIYRELADGDHFIWDTVMASRRLRNWIRTCRRRESAVNAIAPPSADAPPRGPIGQAFLGPFLFVLAGQPPALESVSAFYRAARDWYAYAQAAPRMAAESDLTPHRLARYHLFLFGEPEQSPCIRAVLSASPVQVEGDRFRVGDRFFSRRGNGLFLVRPNPWNPRKLAVVQCGRPWGEGAAENHKYDFLPDYIVYTDQADPDGSNQALAAGFFNASWQLD